MKAAFVALAVALCLIGSASAAPAAAASNGGTECLICQFLVKELDQYLTSPSTVSKIVGYIEDVCHLLPSSDRSACKSFIDQYGESLVDWIASELSSDEICNDILDLGCSDVALKKAVKASLDRFADEKLGSTCDICKDVIGALKQALDDPQTEKDITKALTSVCSGLGALKDICVDLVNDWAPDVISWLDGKLNPSTVCGDIHVCASNDKAAPSDLLGAKRCTWGPSYWCKNEDTATECGAMEHCQKYVWTKDQ